MEDQFEANSALGGGTSQAAVGKEKIQRAANGHDLAYDLKNEWGRKRKKKKGGQERAWSGTRSGPKEI